MYNKILGVILFLCILSSLNLYSQEAIHFCKDGCVVKSVVIIQQESSSIGSDKNDVQSALAYNSSNSSKKIFSRLITFSEKQPGDEIFVKRSFDRIQTSIPGPVGVEEYDSNNPFEEGEGAKGFVHSYLPYLKKNIKDTIFVNIYNDFLPGKNSGNEAFEKWWSEGLPVLDTVKLISGIYFTKIMPVSLSAGTSWTDSISTPTYTVTTKYTMVKKENNKIFLLLNSTQVFGANKTVASSDNKVAGSISLTSSIKSKQFYGEIVMESTTLFIDSMQLKTITESSIELNGSEQTAVKRGIITVVNEMITK